MTLLEFIKVLDGLDGPKDRIHVFAKEVQMDNERSITGDIMSCTLTLHFPRMVRWHAQALYDLVSKGGSYKAEIECVQDGGRRVDKIKALGETKDET